MSANNGIFILETTNKTENEYRIIATHEFDGLYFSYIDNDIHNEALPTRLIEYFEKSDPIFNKYQAYNLADQMLHKDYYEYGITVIYREESWDSLIKDAKKYAKQEIKAIKERNDSEIEFVIPILERILAM